MTRDAYVNEFMGYFRDDLPREAFKLLIRYGENLVTQLRGDEALLTFNCFRDAGMEAQARGFYVNLNRYGVSDNSKVTTVDDLLDLVDKLAEES